MSSTDLVQDFESNLLIPVINVPQVHIITDIITPTDTKRTALECQDSKYKTTTYGIRTFPLAIVTMFIVMFIIFHHTRISSC